MAINFPGSLDTFSDAVDNTTDAVAMDINDVRDAIEALAIKVGSTDSGVTASLDYKVNNFFATGRKLWLYENTAPTGWTYQSGLTDVVLAVKGGSNAYNANGGTSAGTWTQPDHSLTIPEMPPHDHSIAFSRSGYAGAGGALERFCSNSDTDTGIQGSGDDHNHGTTYRPAATIGIIVAKD